MICECKKHGKTRHKMLSNGKNRTRRLTCVLCLRERQKRVRDRKKEVLVGEAGGKCVICGYDNWIYSLDFHHTDKKQKELSISKMASLSLERCRKEAKKCVLLCKNCHSEIETGNDNTVNLLRIAMQHRCTLCVESDRD